MEKRISQIVFWAILLLPSWSFSQGGGLGNTRFGPANFLGFNGGVSGPLDIRNDFNDKIKLSTNSIERMWIEGGNSTSIGGKVSFFETTPPGIYNPRARVNIYQGSGRSDLWMTTGTRTSFDEGLLMYYDNSNDRAYLGNLTLQFGANLDLGAGWNGFPGSLPPARLTAFGIHTSPSLLNNRGGVGIHWDSSSAIDEPGALLHIGNKFNSSLLGLQGKQGWRDWMSVGTFNFAGGSKCPGDPSNSGGANGTDNFYVGLLYQGGCPNNPSAGPPNADRYDAVLAWGDDEGANLLPSPGPDFMRVIFTGGYTGSNAKDNAGGNLGREVMRFDPNSRIGIGNYVNGINVVNNRPARRLEILTDFINTSTGEPQFRLTYGQQTNVNPINTGKFTDFFTTQNGDLNIDPRDNTQTTPFNKDRYVGIHTNTPGNTLEINSQLATSTTANGATPVPGFGAPSGKAGLRFSDLRSNSNPQGNPGNGVLSVDANGDVIYVPSANVNGGNNGIFINAGIAQLGIPCQFSTISQKIANGLTTDRIISLNGNNFIFGDGGKVGIGMALAGPNMICNPGNKLEIDNGAANPNTSGLRLTRLTSASPTSPTNNKVLTVNANGDVILVPDQTATAGSGVTNAQNGLNIPLPNTVELGGTLLQTTAIDLNGNVFNYYNGAVKHRENGPNGGTYRFAIGPNTASGSSSFYDVVHANGTGWNHGRTLDVRPVSTSVASLPSSGLVGEELLVSGTALTGPGAISGDVFGYWARTENINSTNGNNYSFRAQANGSAPGKENVGYLSTAKGGGLKNYGFYSVTDGTGGITIEDIGIRVHSQSDGNTPKNAASQFVALYGQNVYGVLSSIGGGSNTNYGVFAETNASAIANYGIYAKAPGIITTSKVSYAGYFDGYTYFNGNIYGVGTFGYSDQTLKMNIDTISNARNIINQLKPKTFYYDTLNASKINFSEKKQYGLIAQDVELILPELVGTVTKPAERDSLGNIVIPSVTHKTLNYNAFIAILIKGMQLQQRQIEKQDSIITKVQSQLAALTSSISSCCSSSSIRTTKPEELNQLDINLSDKDVIVLNQNVPNPFAEQTTITYNVPEKYNYAQIIFSTIDGKIIKAVDITKKGRGQLNVFANDLSSGLYTYSLVVDGKVIDTKKMVKGE